MPLKDFFKLGGWAMWPLLVFSTVTVGLILERLIYILMHNLKVKDIKQKLLGWINIEKVEEAMDYCMGCPERKISARIFLAGISAFHLGEHRMERAMETEASERINGLENGFNLLIAIGSIAPITGFLGTVSGMIGAFNAIANAEEVNAQLVAGGIFEALITTAFGLAIAIVAITAYNIFTHIVDKFAAQIEETGSEIVTRMLMNSPKREMNI